MIKIKEDNRQFVVYVNGDNVVSRLLKTKSEAEAFAEEQTKYP